MPPHLLSHFAAFCKYGSAQQVDAPVAGCALILLGGSRWSGPGNPGRWADNRQPIDYMMIIFSPVRMQAA